MGFAQDLPAGGDSVSLLIAIDPGPTESAYVFWDGERISQHGKIANEELLERLAKLDFFKCCPRDERRHPLYIEMIASYGMAVGKEVFETCVWIGRFLEAYGGAQLVYRKEVKLHLCGTNRAKDSNIIQALKDRFGDKGTKKDPGLTYGLKADVWQAFALAVYAADKASKEAA